MGTIVSRSTETLADGWGQPNEVSRSRRILKWIGYGGAGLLLLVLLAVIVAIGYLRTGLPPVDEQLQVDGLVAPVQVMRDEYSIPHIFAARNDDAYFALGWVHAGDRMLQMEMTRRVGAGRLAELLGEGVVPFDRFMRTLGLYRLAEAGLDSLSPDVRSALDSYAAGVNYWIENHEGAWPAPFYALGLEPEPWKPADSLVWGKLMALQLSGDYRRELRRRRIAGEAGWRIMNLVMPADVPGPVTLPDLRIGVGSEASETDPNGDRSLLEIGSDAWLAQIDAGLPDPLGPDSASNFWIVEGSHTDTGQPILANDPHLGLDTPIMWYLARISTPELSVAGATVPGVPFTVLGNNGRIAWGLTTTGSDTQDLYIERVDPENEDNYLTEDGPRPFDVREETILVGGGEPVTLTVRSTRHGPVIDDLLDDEERAGTEEGHVLSLAWTGFSAQDTTSEALYRLNHAENWEDFTAALQYWVTPQQNVAYADTSGLIGVALPGHIPIRSRGDGRLPVPGWTGTHQWTHMIPFEDLPRAINPEQGWIVNANNRLVDEAYPHLIGHGYAEGYRAQRIEESLERLDGTISVSGSLSLLMDSRSAAAEDVLPLMLAATRAETTTAADVLTLLRSWDYSMLHTKAEPTIFAFWLAEAQRALIEDELGDTIDDVSRMSPNLVATILTEERDLCDDVRTEDVAESCSDTLLVGLDRAVGELSDRFGDRPQNWLWGKVHRAPLEHQVYSRIPVVSWLTDISVKTDGGPFTVQRGDGSHYGPERFQHTHGAGFRAVYDLSDLAQSRYMIATGQSGSPLSRFYGNFTGPWRRGETITLSGTPGELADRGRGTVTFRPSQ